MGVMIVAFCPNYPSPIPDVREGRGPFVEFREYRQMGVKTEYISHAAVCIGPDTDRQEAARTIRQVLDDPRLQFISISARNRCQQMGIQIPPHIRPISLAL